MIVNVTPINTEELAQTIEACFSMKMPLYIHGGPGIGKSDVVRQVCQKMDWKLIDLRLTTIDASDIRGIGIPDRELELMKWLRPEFFPTENIPTVIFLDELSAAEKRLQASCYELILDRRVGKYQLPDNVYVMAAGNDIEDGAIAHEMGTALADRFLHVKLQPSVPHWVKYALAQQFHPAVITYIQIKPDYFNAVQGQSDDNNALVTPTPRSWEKVSQVMNLFFKDRVRAFPLVQGLVGSAAAGDFFSCLDEILELPPIKELLEMPVSKAVKKVPAKTSALYGLAYSCIAYCKTKETLEASCNLFDALANVKDKLQRQEIQTLFMELWLESVFKIPDFTKILTIPSFLNYRKKMDSFV